MPSEWGRALNHGWGAIVSGGDGLNRNNTNFGVACDVWWLCADAKIASVSRETTRSNNILPLSREGQCIGRATWVIHTLSIAHSPLSPPRATVKRRSSISHLVDTHDTILSNNVYIISFDGNLSTYDHRVWKTGLPVRSAVLKPHAGELVVGWVTTSESSLLYVFTFLFFFVFRTLCSIMRSRWGEED